MAALATAELTISSENHRSVFNENAMDWQQNPSSVRAIYARKQHNARIKYGTTKIERKRQETLVESCMELNEAVYKNQESFKFEVKEEKENPSTEKVVLTNTECAKKERLVENCKELKELIYNRHENFKLEAKDEKESPSTEKVALRNSEGTMPESLAESCMELKEAMYNRQENFKFEAKSQKENPSTEKVVLSNTEGAREAMHTRNEEPRDVVQKSESLSELTAIQIRSPKRQKVVYRRSTHSHSVPKSERKTCPPPTDISKQNLQDQMAAVACDEKLQTSKRPEIIAPSPRKKPTKKAKVNAKKPPSPPLKLPKLHLVLSRSEINEDWVKMTGQRYTGRPRKSAVTLLGLGMCTSLTCPSTIRYLKGPW